MRYCINTQMFSPDLCLVEKIKILGLVGLNGVEPWIDEIENGNIGDICKCSSDYGVEIVAMQQLKGWFENDGGIMGVGDDHRAIMNECKRRMELSASVGCRWIVAAPALSNRNHFGSWEQGIDHYRILLEIGRDIGCLPSVEFLGQTKQIYNFSLCKKFIDDIDDESATMIVDSYHLWRGGGAMNDFENYPKEKISMFHLSDADKAIEREDHMDRNRVMPLDGKLDLGLFAEAVKKIGFDGFVNAGVYNKLLWEIDPIKMATDCLTRMKTIFQSGNV